MQHHFESVRDALVVAVCAALLVWGAAFIARPPVDPSAKPNPNGKYDLTLVALGRGTGKAIVTTKKVKIDAKLDDGKGNILILTAPKLNIDNSTYRFTGIGTLNMSTVNLSGRIDP